MYLWAPGDQPWSDTRVRFELLSVISGRIEADVWSRFDAATHALPEGQASVVWVPGDELAEDEVQWRVAPMPVEDDARDRLGDTGEFEVALLNAGLQGAMFLPGADDTADSYGSWLVAPKARA